MRRERGRQRERGAVLVETSLVVVLLLLLAVGIAEVGLAGVDQMTAANAAREGARVGATAGTDANADTAILAVVDRAMCNLRYGDVTKVYVYEAGPDGERSPDVSTYVEYTPGPGACGSRSYSGTGDWVPANRDNVPDDDGLDSLGVEIQYTHDWILGLFQWAGSADFSDRAVMRMQPEVQG